MGLTALLMAGGKGSRLKVQEEKPLLQVSGKPMIEYVLNALKGAHKVNDVIVTVSKYTPKTAAFVRKLRLKAFQTPGKGFCLDTRYAIEKLKLRTVLTICADLPLVTSELIDKVATHYERCGKPALTVMTPLETYKKLGLNADYVFTVKERKLVPVGINVIDGRRIKEKTLDQEVFIVDDARIVVNVNTLEDLKTVELILRQKV
ncbi:MAG: NTP transferase domain-containing protein [Candidatus Freyarchaeota archaeon]